MVIPGFSIMTNATRRAARFKTGGLWHAISAQIEGCSAVKFERERRVTLLSVPVALPPGTEVYDQRADGGTLVVRVPAAPGVVSVLAGDVPVIRSPGVNLTSNWRITARPEGSERHPGHDHQPGTGGPR
jgi:hypothetical protein